MGTPCGYLFETLGFGRSSRKPNDDVSAGKETGVFFFFITNKRTTFQPTDDVYADTFP